MLSSILWEIWLHGNQVLGGVFALRGQITIGDIQAFVQYSRWFTMPITQAPISSNMPKQRWLRNGSLSSRWGRGARGREEC